MPHSDVARPIGNASTRCRFKPDMLTFSERWSEAGPARDFAPGIVRQISTLRQVARWFNMEAEAVAL